ncbi:MAG: erythromycin biosynthesis sensory transduction protein eryC1 [Betaproteobacteria bacterium HGW-Betaproteobacteria-11]|nr:MAG: erythromycin biosynthesis sensory transduction protein eryC1 [Betaproteobacteria bacterium HGW-Betaproteobacteria-11]
MNIPMLDLKAEYELLRAEIEPAMLQALAACQYIGGPNVKAFEAEAAAYAGSRHAIACASGTDALLLALRACGIEAGDEVITTPFTFVATASTILMCKATPVFVDIDPRSFNLDLDQVTAAITPRTRAIVPVHLFGQPVQLAPLRALCEKHGCKLIEDAAQSFGADLGARCAGRKSGAYGDIGCTSFYPSKNLSAFGDGGLTLTDDDALAAELRVLASHGSRQRYHHHVLGYNSRLDELQAVILRIKLKRLDEFNTRRRAIASLYDRLLADVVETPFADGHGRHVYHQYTILSDRRDELQKTLTEAGIACAVYYPVPLHRQELFAASHGDVRLPVAERTAQRCLSLPISPLLRDEQIERIATVIREALQ